MDRFSQPLKGEQMLELKLEWAGRFYPWRRWLVLVVDPHHGAQPAWPATKIAAVK